LNESRTVTNVVSNTVVEIDSPFSGSPTLLRFSQKSTNLNHNHGGNTGNTQPTFISGQAGAFKPSQAGISGGFFSKGSTIQQNSMTNSSWDETYVLNYSYTPSGTVQNHSHTINSSGDAESRPFNFTVKIWVRTA
jgi:hypothetical protein